MDHQIKIWVLMILLYGIATFFHRHQGSHLAYIKLSETEYVKGGRVTIDPLLILILWLYNVTLLPWLVLIFIGFKTVWYYSVIVLLASQIVSFGLSAVEMRSKLNGALISLFGIIVIPLALFGVYLLSSYL